LGFFPPANRLSCVRNFEEVGCAAFVCEALHLQAHGRDLDSSSDDAGGGGFGVREEQEDQEE